MATISENLEELKTAKASIKSAIENKGQDLTDVPFTQYGDKIGEIQTSNVDLSQTTATADDVLEGKEFFNASGEKVAGTYVDMLQQRVDEKNSCAYLVYNYTGYNLDFLNRLDTSKIITMSHMFAGSDYITTIPSLDTGNVTNMSYMFSACEQLTTVLSLDTENVTDMSYMFNSCYKLTTVPPLNTNKVTNMKGMFGGCKVLTTLQEIDARSATNMERMFEECYRIQNIQISNTINSTNMQKMFYDCSSLETVSGLDLRKISTNGYGPSFYDCKKLTNLTLKNIRVNLQIGSGTTYGHLLTLESLLNTIKELWTNTSTGTRTLTMGTANTAKLADVYVKLIPITDEMRAEDEYIDNKAPFVQCESTDEGAMLVTEYVTTVKNWSLA